jgi:hypothetical protein
MSLELDELFTAPARRRELLNGVTTWYFCESTEAQLSRER